MQQTVLVAEDSPENLEMLVYMLEHMEEHFRVLRATNGREALKLAVQEEPDLALFDWDMPEMNGIEVMQAMKQMKQLEHIPVIIATAFASSGNLSEAFEKGAVDYIKKPIDRVELIARVRSTLRLSESYQRIKEQKQKIEQQKDELEQANQLKDRLFSIISHDMKGPLQSLTSLLDIFLKHSGAISIEELTTLTQDIRQSLSGVNFLMTNLLKWSLSQMNKVPFEPAHIDVTTLVKENISLYKEPAGTKKIAVKHKSAKSKKAFADEDSVSFIVRNLLANAIKFTQKGGKITISEVVEGKNYAIAISDNGVGIPSDKIDTLFDETGNTSTPGTAKEKGTGIGLPLCKEFAEKNNGKLLVESKEGKGSTFTLLLPIK